MIELAETPFLRPAEFAQDMTPEQRTEMIRGMVGRLGDRLAAEGGPPQDWARLISSLRMLGEVEHAGQIAEEARARFAADPAALQAIDQALSAPAGVVQ